MILVCPSTEACGRINRRILSSLVTQSEKMPFLIGFALVTLATKTADTQMTVPSSLPCFVSSTFCHLALPS